MRNILIMPDTKYNLLETQNAEIVTYAEDMDLSSLDAYTNIFVYEKDPYVANLDIAKLFLREIKEKRKIDVCKMYNAFRANICYYNSIPHILESLKYVEEKVVLVEDSTDILNNL